MNYKDVEQAIYRAESNLQSYNMPQYGIIRCTFEDEDFICGEFKCDQCGCVCGVGRDYYYMVEWFEFKGYEQFIRVCSLKCAAEHLEKIEKENDAIAKETKRWLSTTKRLSNKDALNGRLPGSVRF